MRISLAIPAVVLAVGVVVPSMAGACLEYEPATISLKGKLVRRTFPGPPNYESVASGDASETYWLLELERPICVNGKPNQDTPEADPAKDVREVQLMVAPEMYKTRRSLVGGLVVATGSLYHGISGHHHTEVLLDTKSLEKAQ